MDKEATQPMGPWRGDDKATAALLVDAESVSRTLGDELRALFPEWDWILADSMVRAFIPLRHRPFRTIIVGVTHAEPRLRLFLSSLCELGGGSARIVLCAPAALEALAVATLPWGVDDYFLYPLDHHELFESLEPAGAIHERAVKNRNGSGPPAGEMDEIHALAQVLAHLDDGMESVGGSVAQLIRDSFHATGVEVLFGDRRFTAGRAAQGEVYALPIPLNETIKGQILIQGRDPKEGPPESGKGALMARMCGMILEAASLHASTREERNG